ncbi:hypothetical protein [Actinosynnema sp. NPDC020468]|uniref:beta strand repeat-containing protein n=1 Tax=Actinosynnema sp. NPDC020468 TaxID=3154488 RepID=UPI0033F1C056
MQTWAKRGIQTAIVTGGLLMLGTGIASADENVSPDRAPSAIDSNRVTGNVIVPIDLKENVVATPLGTITTPEVHRSISTEGVTGALSGKTGAANPLVRGAQDKVSAVSTGSSLTGNRVDADVVVPIRACGNAVAVLRNASVEADCSYDDIVSGDAIETDGEGQSLSGNVVSIANATPTQITGNAVSVLATADAKTTASQSASAGSDITTSGKDSSLSGNIAAVQSAVPVQLTNNAATVGGRANSESTAENTALAPGSLTTTGEGSALGGNVLGAPLAPIAAVNGNAAAVAGKADTVAENTSTAEAGSTHTGGVNDIDTWLETSGKDGSLAGNVIQPQLAGPVSVDDNAVAGAGNGSATSSTTNFAKVGGFTSTTAEGGSLAGNLVDAPAALPVSGGGNAVGGLGNVRADHTNDVTAVAGSGTYTNGDRSVLGANSANAPVGGAVDLCGTGVAGGGNSSAVCENDVITEVGGYNGTTGNDSVGSGNIGQLPVAIPGEGFANSIGVAGNASGTAVEDKGVRVGGDTNTRDDNGTISSNVVSVPTGLGAQAFGLAGGAFSNPTATGDSNTTLTAGGEATATGKHGSVAGNIVQVPTSNPAQIFGDTVLLGGNGSSTVANSLDATSGGDSTSTGEGGSLAGNVITAPQTSSPQVYGHAINGLGNTESTVDNTLTNFSGGKVTTTGKEGSLSGNGVSAAPAIPSQVQGDAVTVGGNGKSTTTNDSTLVSGGDSTTDGTDAAVSGILANVPVNGQPSAHGNAVTALGKAATVADSTALTSAGGKATTTGDHALSGSVIEAPIESAVRAYDIPAEIAGQALTTVTDDNTQLTGEEASATNARGIELPGGVDHLLPATGVPALGGLTKLPKLPVAQDRSFKGQLPLVGDGLNLTQGGLPGLGTIGGLGGLTSLVPAGRSLPTAGFAQPRTGALPAVPGLAGILPSGASLTNLDLNPLQGLPALPTQSARSFSTPTAGITRIVGTLF